MSIGKERYEKNVVYINAAPSIHQGYMYLYLLGEEGMMYYYEFVAPENNEPVRDMFVREILSHCMYMDGKMRVSFVFAANIIHSLTEIVHPQFLGMDAELESLDGEEAEEDAAPEEDMHDDGFADDGGFSDDEYASDPVADDIGLAEDDDDGSPWGRGGSFGGAVVTQDDPSIALAGTESVPHEAVGSVDQIADTPIPFELWLFSIKKLGQNFAAASEHYERLSPEEQEALHAEYNATFGL